MITATGSALMAEPLSTGPVPAGWIVDASGTTLWRFPDEPRLFAKGLFDMLGEQVVWAPRKHREARTKPLQCFLGGPQLDRPRRDHGQAAAAVLEIRSRINRATALLRPAP